MRKLFSVCALLFFSSSVSAYVLSAPWKPPTGTDVATVKYKINTTNVYGFSATQIKDVIADAANVWMAANPRIQLQFDGYTTSDPLVLVNGTWTAICDGINIIGFNNVRRTDLLAEAISCYEYQSGARYRKTNVDIAIHERKLNGNRRPFLIGNEANCSPTAWYLMDVLTHELGHFIGFSHTPINEATMYKSTSQCSKKWRSLAADDKAGLLQLYPNTM